MNAKVFCALFLAASMVLEEGGKAHIELSEYQEAPRLTYAYTVNSTATITTHRFLFDRYDQFT
jgi:hypothetical protein